jgi:hypothetical protein
LLISYIISMDCEDFKKGRQEYWNDGISELWNIGIME